MKLLKIVTSHFTVSVVERLLLRVVSLVLSVLLLPLATTALAPVGDCKVGYVDGSRDQGIVCTYKYGRKGIK